MQSSKIHVVLHLENINHDTLAVMQQGIMFAQAFCFADNYFVVLQARVQ